MSSEKIERILPRLFAVAIAASPFAIDYRFWKSYFHDYADLPQMLFLQTATALFAAGFLFLLARRHERKLAIPFFLPPLAAFLLWCGLSLAWSVNPYEGKVLLAHWAACAAAGLLIAQWTRGARDARWWMEALLWSCGAVSLLGALQAYGVPVAAWVPQNLAPAATFGHRNAAVQFLALTGPIAGILWLYSDDPKRRWAYAAVLSISCAYILLAASRAGLAVLLAEIAMAAVLTGIFARTRLRLDRGKLVALAAAAAFTLACVLLRPAPQTKEVDDLWTRVSSALEDVSSKSLLKSSPPAAGVRESSLKLRLVFWRNTLEMIKASPFRGVGLGNFKIHYPAYGRKAMQESSTGEHVQLADAHNDYLQILSETGFAGFGLAIWLAILVGYRLVRHLREEPDETATPVLLIIGTGLFGLAVDACVSFPLYKPLPPFLLMTYLGLLAGMDSTKREIEVGKSAAFVLTAIGVIILAGVVHGGSRKGRAEAAYTRALTANAAQEWDATAKHARAALALDPGRKKILFLLGKGLHYSGRPLEAIEPLQRLSAAYPFYINGLFVLGEAYREAGRAQQSLAAYKRCLAVRPDYARAFHGMGRLFLKTGSQDKALAAMKEAVRFAPENPQFQIHLGQVAKNRGDLDAAAAAFKNALRLSPPEDRPFIREQLADLESVRVK